MIKSVITSRLWIFAWTLFLFTSCLDDDETPNSSQQLAREIEAIDAFLASNNLSAIKDAASGIRIVIHQLGTGVSAPLYSTTVNVDYTGKFFSDGTTFDSGTNKNFVLNSVIDGWKIAFTKIPTGTRATLYIPSVWAYGEAGFRDIPGNATLVFDVTFRGIVYSDTEKQRFTTDTTAIETYLSSKGIVAETDSLGIRYVQIASGLGDSPGHFDRIKFKYTIWNLSDDTREIVTTQREPTATFDSRPSDFILAINQATQRMQKGSKLRVYAPSGYCFGTQTLYSETGAITVPANSNLIIEIELLDVIFQ